MALDKYENTWASIIGHPCTRYLYLKRTAPKLEIISEEKKILFKKGAEIEAIVIDEFKKEGFEIIDLQKRFEIKEYKLAGKIDCIIKYQKIEYPCEIKSTSNTVWNNLYTYADFLQNEYYYVRMYPAQLQLYLYAYKKKFGYFYLRNKSTNQGRFIKVSYDRILLEEILNRSMYINKSIEQNNMPEKISDISICRSCGFFSYCYQ